MNADWYVYVLECTDDTLYTGITTDPERRLREHNESSKGAAYTRSRRPVEMRALWPCEDQSEAASAEAAFKKLTRDQKLDRLGVGLDGETLEALADEYLEVFDLDEASASSFQPLSLAGDDARRLEHARTYRALVDDHLDALEAQFSDRRDVFDRVTPRFVVGPGFIDGHGLLVDGKPIVLFNMRLIERHVDEEGFRPDVHVAHELMHAVHYDLAPSFYPGREKSPAEEVWHRLVAEGLAQRGSEVLTECNPQLSTWFGVLDEPSFEVWVERAREIEDSLADMLDLEESIRFDGNRWDDLFRGTGDLETTRLGYWWGRHLVERAEEEYDFEELFVMPPEDWEPIVRAVVSTSSSKPTSLIDGAE